MLVVLNKTDEREVLCHYGIRQDSKRTAGTVFFVEFLVFFRGGQDMSAGAAATTDCHRMIH